MDTSRLDALVSDPRLQPGARAVLLLRACVLAQALRPDVLERYWGELKALARDVPAGSKESFEGLRDTLEPPEADSAGGLAGQVAEALEAAKRTGNRVALVEALGEAERRVKGKRLPFGKKAAWDVLVRAWIDVDRTQAFAHLEHLSKPVQTNILIRENDRSPLSADEWSTVHRLVPKAARPAVEELLERDETRLELSAGLAEDVGQDLLKAMFKGGTDDREAETKRDGARARYAKLVDSSVERSPDVAEALLERWFHETAATDFYKESWVERFFALFRLIALWSSYPALEPKLGPFVSSDAPAHVRDAALAHAAGLKPTTAAEAEAAWAALEPQVTDKAPAEHWFLLTLLRGGLPEQAYAMARRSPRAERIVPALRLAWLYEHPDSARTAFTPTDVAGDGIAELLLRDQDDRVELLRTRTRSGETPLPEAMWKAPVPTDLLRLGGDDDDSKPAEAAIGSWYAKSEKLENQFSVFVRTNGYGQHLYERFDPILLGALVAWDDAHPDEVGALTRRMWDTMQPAIRSYLRLDLVRNSIIERCQSVLGAHPDTAERFVKWIYTELVRVPVTETVGTTTYTFQLNERAPFLFALLTAQKVAGASPQRCDEILKGAIGEYTATDELMTAAAHLYASDKGLAALEPPAPLKQAKQLGAWQLGVVDTAIKDVLAALVADVEPTPAEPTAGVAEAFHGIPGLGVRFDIGKVDSGTYGLECWRVFWGAIDPSQLAGSILYEGDTAATLGGSENVFCIAVRTADRAALQRARELLERSPEFQRVAAASPEFIDEDRLAGEPLPEAGRITTRGELESTSWSKVGLDAVRGGGAPPSDESSSS